MELFKIQNDLIAGRTADAWYRISDGPTFRYGWEYGAGADGPFSYIYNEHYAHAVSRDEPTLTMSWGLDVDSREDGRNLDFEWAKAFANSTVRRFWVDFYWNAALIDRVMMCSIDGGHGTIPMPSYNMHVTEFEVAVADLLHDLTGANEDEPSRYLDMLSITRVRDQERQGAGSA